MTHFCPDCHSPVECDTLTVEERPTCRCGDPECDGLDPESLRRVLRSSPEGCVICGQPVEPKDSGLCAAHKYDEQLGFTTHLLPGSHLTLRWWHDPGRCSHTLGDVCATCDLDGYYQDQIRAVPADPNEED